VSDSTYCLGGSDRGLWLGLGPVRLAVLAGSVLAAVTFRYVGAPLPVAAAIAGAGALWCLTTTGGVSVHEWAGTAAHHVLLTVTSKRCSPAALSAADTSVRVEIGDAVMLPATSGFGRLALLPLMVDGVELAVAAERARSGWEITAVFDTIGPTGFTLADDAEQARLIASWADVLSALTGEYAGRCRLQWIERARGQDATALQAWAATHGSPEAGEPGSLLDTAQSSAVRHDTVLAVQVATGARDRDHAVRHAEALCRLLAGRLGAAQIVPQPLDLTGLALRLRQGSEPAATDDLFSGAVRSHSICPASRRVAWDHLRTDDTFHRTFVVTGWPRVPVGPSWLAPLLVTGAPGAVRTISVHYDSVPVPVATRRARAARQGADLDADDRVRLGFGIGARDHRAQADAAAAEAELAAGHVQHRIAAVAVVSAGDLAALDEASRQLRAAASSSRLDLRPLHGRHADGWAAALPLCRLRHRAAA